MLNKEKEIDALKMENLRLEKLCDEELVIVEKVEFKEVYGRKHKMEKLEEKEQKSKFGDSERQFYNPNI